MKTPELEETMRLALIAAALIAQLAEGALNKAVIECEELEANNRRT